MFTENNANNNIGETYIVVCLFFTHKTRENEREIIITYRIFWNYNALALIKLL